jgi:hypothetical protein
MHPIAGVDEGPVVVVVVEHGPGARGEVGRTHSHVPEKRKRREERRAKIEEIYQRSAKSVYRSSRTTR